MVQNGIKILLNVMHFLNNQNASQILLLINNFVKITIGRLRMESCIEKILTHIAPMASYSGRYFMRVGNYNDCIRT